MQDRALLQHRSALTRSICGFKLASTAANTSMSSSLKMDSSLAVWARSRMFGPWTPVFSPAAQASPLFNLLEQFWDGNAPQRRLRLFGRGTHTARQWITRFSVFLWMG